MGSEGRKGKGTSFEVGGIVNGFRETKLEVLISPFIKR